MKEFQSIVKSFILDRRKHTRYIIFLTFLCMIVLIAVSCILIKPAVSQTGTSICGMEVHTHDSTCYDVDGNLICSLTEHIHNDGCFIDEDLNGNYDQYIQPLSLNNPSDSYEGYYGGILGGTIGNATVGTGGNTADKVYSTFSTTYGVPSNVFIKSDSGIAYIGSEGNTIVTFQLPELSNAYGTLDIAGGFSNRTFKDTAGVEAGVFSISEDGVVTLNFSEEYLKSKYTELTQTGCTGNISFNAYCHRDESNTGDVKFDNDGLTGEVTFPERKLNLEKTNGTIKRENGTVEWTIKVSGDSENMNWNGYYISDSMFGVSGCELVSSNPENCGQFSNGNFVFGDVKGKEVSFTYSTPISTLKDEKGNSININSENYITVKNSASLYDKDGKPKKENITSSVTLNPLTVEKTSWVQNGEVEWTITVENGSGFDLSDYPIEDSAFSSATNITVETTPSGIDYEQSGDKITIKGNPSRVVVKYKTPFTTSNIFESKDKENSTISNTVKIAEKEDTEKVGYTGVTLEKEAYLDSDGVVTWKLKIKNDIGFNLKGLVISDTMFNKAIPDSIKCTQGNATIEKSGNDYVITSDTNSTYVEVEYKTNLSDVVTGGIKVEGGSSDDNTAKLTKDGNSTDEVKKHVDYNRVDITNKKGELVGNAIKWSITVSNPYGLDLTGNTVTDSMFQYNKDFTSEYGTINGNTFTFNSNTKDQKIITIEYTTPLDSLPDYSPVTGGDFTNEANFNNNEPKKDTVHADGNIGLNKQGTFDYNYEYYSSNADTVSIVNGKYQQSNDTVVWTINVTANYGNTLNGTTIVDSKFNDITVINNADGSIVDPSNYTLSGGNLTINTSLTDITIVYATPAEGSGNASYESKNHNDVSVGDLHKPADWDGTYDPYNVTKSNSVADKLVTWKIDVRANGKTSLNGFIVKDDMLSNAIDGSIKVSQGTFTNNGDGSITLNTTSRVVTIEYQTNAVDTSSLGENPTKEQIKTLPGTTNRVTIEKDGKTWDEDESVQKEYTPKNEIHKNQTGYSQTDPDGSGTVDWTVQVIRDAGFADGNITITDLMKANVEITPDPGEGDNRVGEKPGIHYMTSEQLNNIVIKYSYQNTNPLFTHILSKDYYTSTLSDDGTTLTIAFDPSIDTSILSMQVEYTTTADLRTVEGGKDSETVNIVLTNEASTDEDHKDDEQYTIEKFNAKNQPFKKYGVDRTIGGTNILLEANPERTTDELDIINIDGKDYYLFPYMMLIDASRVNQESIGNNGFSIQIYDTLPDGFTLYQGTEYPINLYYSYNNNGYVDTVSGYNKDDYYNTIYNGLNTSNNGYYYDNDNGQISFWLTGLDTTTTIKEEKVTNIVGLKYTLMISVDDFNTKMSESDGAVLITNAISSEEPYEPYEDTQTVTEGEVPNVTQTDIVDKTSKTNNDAGSLAYSIEVNKDAKTISNTGSLILSDNFFITGATLNDGKTILSSNDIDPNDFDVDIASFKVTDLDTGKDVTNECSYIISDPNSTSQSYVSVDSSYTMNYSGYNNTYTLTGNQLVGGSNNKVKFTFFGDCTQKVDESGNVTYPIDFGNSGYPEGTVVSYDAKNDKTTFEFILDSNCSAWINDYLQINSTIGQPVFTLEVSKPVTDKSTKNLQITVPDGRHLRVDYKYSISYKNLEMIMPDSDTVKAKNVVSVNTGNYYDSSSETSETYFMSSAQADVTTNYVTITKYDLNNYTTTINAGFNVARWNGSSWEYASGVANDGKPIDSVTWSTPENKSEINTTNGKLQMNFETGYLYKLEECTPPDGYVGLRKPLYFHVGEGDSNLTEMSNGIPEADFNINDVSNISVSKELNVANYQNIDITVQKSWDDGNTLHDNDSIIVQLYKSYSKVVGGFPTSLEPVLDDNGNPLTMTIYKDSYTRSDNNIEVGPNENLWIGKFTGLQSGTEDGRRIYYYVKEVSYYIDSDDTTYQVEDGNGNYIPNYTNNATNQSGTVEVLNSCKLIVQKVWQNSNGDDITRLMKHDDIEFELLRSVNDGTPEVVTINGESKFTLSGTDDNNWKYEFDNLPRTDSSGNTYKYSVREISTDSNYIVTYLSNANGNVGNLKIVNKNSGPEKFRIEVSKSWADGNINHKNDNVTLELYRIVNGTKTLLQEVTLSDENDWYWTSLVDSYYTIMNEETGLLEEQLDASGNRIRYQYEFVETKINGQPVANTEYTVSYENNLINKYSDKKTVTVVNTPPAPPTINVTVNKTWNVPEGVAKPDSIELVLYKAYSENAPESEWEKYKTAIVTPDEITGDWTHVFEELPQYLYYHVKEVTTNTWVPTYTIDGKEYTSSSDFVIKGGNNADGTPNDTTVDIKNTFQVPDDFEISLKKLWDDKGATGVKHDPVDVMLIRSTKKLSQTELDSLSNTEAPSGEGQVSVDNGGSSENIDATNAEGVNILTPTKNDYVSLKVHFVKDGQDVATNFIVYQDGSWSEGSYGNWNVSNLINKDGSVTITPTVEFDTIKFEDGYSNTTILINYVINYKSSEPVPGEGDFTEIETSIEGCTIEMYTKEEIKLNPNDEKTISKLPTKNDADEPYYYYIIEKNVPDGYKVSYSPGQEVSFDKNSIEITNALKTSSLTINKSWIDQDGNDLGKDYKDISGVKVNVYQSTTKPEDISSAGTDEPSVGPGNWESEGGGIIEQLVGTADGSSSPIIVPSECSGKTISKIKVIFNNTGEHWGQIEINGNYYQPNGSTDKEYIIEVNDTVQSITYQSWGFNIEKVEFYTSSEDEPLRVRISDNVVGEGTDKKISISKGSSVEISSNLEGVAYTGYDESVIEIVDGKINVKSTAEVGATTTITATVGSKSVNIPVEVTAIKQATAKLPDGIDKNSPFDSFDVTSIMGWTYTLEDIPLQDASGNPYYYYIEEVSDESVSYYIPISYSGNGVQLSSDETKTISLTNQVTETPPEENGVTLPMTGSTGTTRYYLVGGSIVLLSVMMLAKKRKDF